MNTGNLAQKTTWKFGSYDINIADVYLQEFSLPGINLEPIDIYAQAGAKVALYSDSISYNDLELTLLIDEDYQVYFELMRYVYRQINPQNKTHANQEFTCFVTLTDNKGKDIFTVTFYNARFTAVGDISLSTQGDESYNTLSATIKYDYYLIDKLDISTKESHTK